MIVLYFGDVRVFDICFAVRQLQTCGGLGLGKAYLSKDRGMRGDFHHRVSIAVARHGALWLGLRRTLANLYLVRLVFAGVKFDTQQYIQQVVYSGNKRLSEGDTCDILVRVRDLNPDPSWNVVSVQGIRTNVLTGAAGRHVWGCMCMHGLRGVGGSSDIARNWLHLDTGRRHGLLSGMLQDYVLVAVAATDLRAFYLVSLLPF